MGKILEEIDDELADFIRAQRVFFVATAPLAASGRVNLSPRGLDTFRILSPRRVAWLDLIGSGAETVAHLRENGRIVVMFCAFEGRPRIVRLHGRGEAIEISDPRFAELAPRFPPLAGQRAIVAIEVQRVSTSCGYAVPLMTFEAERPQLEAWHDRKGPEGLERYMEEHNRRSIDGLPALLPRSEGR